MCSKLMQFPAAATSSNCKRYERVALVLLTAIQIPGSQIQLDGLLLGVTDVLRGTTIV